MNNLELISLIIASKQGELESKGYTPDQAAAAIKRSRQWALKLSEKLSPSIREQGFIDLFRDNIAGAETWLANYKEKVTNAS